MVIKVKQRYFEVLKNTKEALNLEQLERCYIEEWYDNFAYVVGDISDGKLRLKQFSDNPRNKDYYEKISKYLAESCNYKPVYFILHRIDENEYKARLNEPENPEITVGDPEAPKLEKESFDKDSLVLTKSQKNRPNIRIDIYKQTNVTAFELPADLKKEIQKERQQEQKANKANKNNRSNRSNNKNNQKNDKK